MCLITPWSQPLQPRTPPSCFSAAPATLCMVCKIFKNSKCLEGNGNCTMEEGPGCRTRDLYFFNERDGWRYNHTELDCSNLCKAWKLFRGGLQVSSFCCKGQDFCNIYRGKSLQWKSH
uniref:UPAR/Ly6 domain-containing protein n=1 Tax=Rhinolophus ferrumequinum TaxID=59479 RepID=A0A671EQU3_RHIFE